MNLKQTQQVALCSDKDDRVNLNAAGRKIFGLAVDELTPEDYDGTALEEATNKRASQAVNIEYLLNWTAHTAKRLAGDARGINLALDANELNIQNGRAAVLAKDFVIKE
jgi:hypothetical protein